MMVVRMPWSVHRVWGMEMNNLRTWTGLDYHRIPLFPPTFHGHGLEERKIRD